MRDNSQLLMRDRTPTQFWDDCTKRFIQFKRRPAYKKAWQSNLASSTPNEKLIGLLSKLATKGMECKVMTTNELTQISLMKERIGNYLLKGAAIKNDDDFQIVLEMLEAFEKGTVIGMEDWFHGKAQIRDVTEEDPETGQLKSKVKIIKKWNDVRSSLINLNDFYPGKLEVRPGKIQDMDDCFYVRYVTEDEFDAEFGGYEDADKVQSFASIIAQGGIPFWRQPPGIGNELIPILYYFNQKTDERVIVAGGIWINPKKGTDQVQELPWNHKHLPFWAGVCEPLDANYFYGRGYVDKLISLCDSGDNLFDKMLDMLNLSANQVVLTDEKAKSALAKGYLQPNNVISTDWTDGKPNFQVVQLPEPPAMGVTMYQLIQQQKERATIAAEVIGGASIQKKTATESDIQNEGAQELVSLPLSFMEFAIRDKNRLRFSNILQFYSMPIHEKDGDKFKKVILRNEEMTTGQFGTVHIQITPEPNQSRVEQMDNSVIQNTEFIEITPDFIRNWEADIEIVPQSSVKQTERQRQILELNYQRVMNELYPDKFNRDAGFEELNLKFNKDPNKMKAKTPDAMGDLGPLNADQQSRAQLLSKFATPQAQVPVGMST